MFSSRTPGELGMNRLAFAVASHRREGRRLFDLTSTNPTAVGITYPKDLLAPLSSGEGQIYSPEPFGLPAAREAVARDYRRRGISVAVDRVVLTASTSEAYSLLFKLLCEPSGEEVLVPAPSYPLFDHLTQLDGVRSRPYGLEYHRRWELDRHSVDAAWTNCVRAILAVSPNNPTGSVLRDDELRFLAGRCHEREAALIVDEVFADFPLGGGQPGPAEGANEWRPWFSDALTFRLGGLSKSAGLPQVKLGWIAVDGPDALVRSALDRLELICDTYLSVSTPVQVAAPELIERGAAVRTAISERICRNYEGLRAAVRRHPAVELLPVEAGWSAVLRIPAHRSEEETVLALLAERDTLVHPGFFFDFPHEAFLVVSLLPDSGIFDEGIRRLLEHVDA